MSGLVEGAFVGYAVTKFLNAIIDGLTTAKRFKSLLKSMESNITLLKPKVEVIEKLLEELGRGEETEEYKKFGELLKEGTELVKSCSDVRFWNFDTTTTYSKKLSELDQSISRYCTMFLAVSTNKFVVETLKEAKHISKRFDQLISSGRIDVNDNVGFSVSCGLHRPPAHTFGLEIPLKELKIKLLDDKVKVLLVCGQGGCGKTTLAKKLCEDSKIKGIYGENIYFLTVSKGANEKALNQLKIICNLVNSNQKLVILDDVWSAQIIDNFLAAVSNLKLLVTSRYEIPGIDHKYQLNLLDEENARKLFNQASSFENVSRDKQEENFVNKLLKFCSGVPLALTVIGSSLRGQHWTVWKKQEREMLDGRTFLDSKEVVLNSLRISLDCFDEKLNETFLDLGAFPENKRIPAAALVDISLELYKEDKFGLSALGNLNQLHERYLASMLVTREDTSKVDGFCNEHFVSQHDLIRQFSIFETNKAPVEDRARLFIDIRGNDVPENFRTLQNKPGSARLVSITTDETFTSNWIDLQLPKTEVLILNMTSKVYTLPDFIKKMNSLKVLIITNTDLFPTELKNLQILWNLPSLKRIRFERISFSSLGQIGTCFQNLTKVTFTMCNIQQAINKCNVQLSEMLPALTEIDINYCDDLSLLPPGLSDLQHLTSLSLTNCPKLSKLPEEISRLSNLKALRLHTCVQLAELPSSITHLKKLKLLDISDCCSIDQLPIDIGDLVCLETLLMYGCSDFQKLPSSVLSLVNLWNVYCDNDTADLWKKFASQLKNLTMNVVKKECNLNWLG